MSPSLDNSAAADAPVSLRDEQRAALHDLVTLATECASREAEIERQYHAAQEDAAKKNQWETSELARRFESAKAQLAKARDEKLSTIESTFSSETAALTQTADTEKRRIEQDYE